MNQRAISLVRHFDLTMPRLPIVLSYNLAPDDPLAWFLLSDAYIKEGDSKKAIDAVDQLIKLQPDNAGALETVARTWFHTNDYRR